MNSFDLQLSQAIHQERLQHPEQRINLATLFSEIKASVFGKARMVSTNKPQIKRSTKQTTSPAHLG
jgi:hypothetical protein